MTESYWKGTHFSFFQNIECEYFPCHKGVATEDFNCLFCYCPLYAFGDTCGGNPTFLEDGIKDCSQCVLPHYRNQYGYVTEQMKRLAKNLARELEKGE